MANLKNVVELDSILFPVEVIDNSQLSNPEYSKVVMGKIGGQNIALNYCSPRYALIPNSEIFPKIEGILLSHGINFQSQYTNVSNVRFYCDLNITDERFKVEIGEGDIIYPKINISHSYNGLTKYSINFGYYRLVCSNGLTIPVEEMKDFNLSITGKHTESISRSLQLLDEKITFFCNNAEEFLKGTTKSYKVLYDNWIDNPIDRIEAILKSSSITAVANKNFNTVTDILDRIEVEKNILGYKKVNDWLIYNAINAHVNDEDLNIKLPEVRQQIDSKVLSYMLS